MTTFIKAELNKSDGQTNIDKSRVTAHYKLQNIMLDQRFKLLHHKKLKNRMFDMDILTF